MRSARWSLRDRSQILELLRAETPRAKAADAARARCSGRILQRAGGHPRSTEGTVGLKNEAAGKSRGASRAQTVPGDQTLVRKRSAAESCDRCATSWVRRPAAAS